MITLTRGWMYTFTATPAFAAASRPNSGLNAS